jgi:hypothetical protein
MDSDEDRITPGGDSHKNTKVEMLRDPNGLKKMQEDK